jgi:PIN like domain
LSRVYFTDRNLGKQFPAILAAAGLQVERHQDLFPPDGSDEQWLKHCGTNGRIAVTHDQRIRYKANELGAVMRHRVAMLVLIGKAPYPELARRSSQHCRRSKHFSMRRSRRSLRRYIAPHRPS